MFCVIDRVPTINGVAKLNYAAVGFSRLYPVRGYAEIIMDDEDTTHDEKCWLRIDSVSDTEIVASTYRTVNGCLEFYSISDIIVEFTITGYPKSSD